MKDVIYTDIREKGIAFLVINKPQRKNAIDRVMMDMLSDQLNALDANPDVKVIILKGEGENFTAGGDLKQAGPEGFTIEETRFTLKKYNRTIRTIQDISKPVIAMVDGYAVGGGMALALACDMIYVSDRVKFTANFVKVGIIPEMGTMMFLPQLMGPYRAKELMFTGRFVEAEEAYKLGIANKVFPAEELEQGTLAFAQEIAALSNTSIQLIKNITNATMSTMLDSVLEAESTASPFCTQTVAYKETAAKFNKK
ncbi:MULTISPECIES: enoyl-CoA hydratase/isomerase family protein [Bacillus]|uniref:enoyl-CoA hydratase/isomerase family protein n=1 Tax=Bacillus TaxID=1386 RepID=UPI00030D9432|nr:MULTISPECIES: enoyl-CoA hydratase/isomerase family protein [Bacillus]